MQLTAFGMILAKKTPKQKAEMRKWMKFCYEIKHIHISPTDKERRLTVL
jgi:hypothetical protein